jgi:hypothetical protein
MRLFASLSLKKKMLGVRPLALHVYSPPSCPYSFVLFIIARALLLMEVDFLGRAKGVREGANDTP